MDNEKFNFKPQENSAEKHEKIKIKWSAETKRSEHRIEREKKQLEKLKTEFNDLTQKNAKTLKDYNDEINKIKGFYKNQDSFFVDKKTNSFGVFDGVGGGPAGDKASKMASDTVLEHISEIKDGTNIELVKQQLSEIIIMADKTVYDLSKSKSEYEGMETTGVVIKIHIDDKSKKYALVSNLGDSRAYKIDKNGILNQITVDDDVLSNYIFDEKERLEIAKKLSNIRTGNDFGGDERLEKYFYQRNMITKAFGSMQNGIISVEAIPVEKGDRFIVTSDGIHDNVTNDRLQEIVRKFQTIEEIKTNIFNEALAISKDPSESIRAKDDDMTIVVVEI